MSTQLPLQLDRTTSKGAGTTNEQEHELLVDKALRICAQHTENGVNSWDCSTVGSVMLSRKGFASSMRPMVTQVVAPRLEGVEHLPNLRELTMGTAMAQQYDGLPPLIVRELRPLSSLTSLTSLCLANTRVADISVLAGLPALRTLSLAQCRDLSNLSPLRGLHLQQLDLSSTSVADISPLAHMSSLEVLRLDWCLAPSLAAHLPGLRVLSLSRSRQMSELTGFSVPELEELDLSGTCDIVDLHPLSAMTKLRVLNLAYSYVSDLSPVAALTNLHHLDISYSEVVDVAPVVGLPHLKGLTATHVPDLAPLQHLQLEELDVCYSQMTDLGPLSTMHSLRYLDVSDCELLADMSALSHLTGLVSLSMDVHSPDWLEHLPLTLTRLTIENVGEDMPATWLGPLSCLTGLRWMCIKYIQNPSVELNLGPLRGLPLEYLRCLKSISDLSPLAASTTLVALECSGTLLEDISPLSRLSRLKWLSLGGCPVRDLTALAQLPLELLDVCQTLVHNLTPLSMMHSLMCLNITGALVRDLSPLSGLTGLQLIAAGRESKERQRQGPVTVHLRPQGAAPLRLVPRPSLDHEGRLEFGWVMKECGWLHRDLVVGRDLEAEAD